MSAVANLLADAKLLTLDPAEVFVPERIGWLHEDKAEALGCLMAADGQRDPIKVVAAKGKNPAQPWVLVTGHHRLHGAILKGIDVVAIEVAGKPEELADLEASENLHRRPLGPLERAKFTAALTTAAQERIARVHGNISHQKLGIKLRWQRVRDGESRAEEALTEEVSDTCATIAQVYGWEESVGEAMGMSRRTIHNDLQLYRLVIEPFSELTEQLAAHPVVGENGAQLKAIAQVKDEALRRKVIEALLADPELSTDDARISVGVDRPAGPAPVAYQKHYDAISGGWSRLGVGPRKAFLPQLAALLTAGEKIELRKLLDEEASA